ncbi:MAG: MFS transporter [Candidatus Auribacter fodinae]|uniref:MFS transporter n=1 Tax=Candidatus Auribacter fodinae TaxID=2093366 RepID=A0A3A4R8F5_9BACT|nr:MAG: MFS transporter [Candidatus Auribacter fodinae]
MFNKLQRIYNDYPRLFWIVVGVSFIDSVGGTLLFPFFALYITQKFGVGMTEAGILLGMFSLFGMIGGMAGGALTDRFGRRRLILFGLTFSALSTLTFGLVNDIRVMYPIAVVVGLIGGLSGPAHNAMIADILPEEKRQEGFGILRVVGNFAWIIGPTIGGLIAKQNFFALFVIDAAVSCVVAALVFRLIPETKPQVQVEAGVETHESIWQTVLGYRVALRDFAFMAFIVASVLMLLVYQQAYGSLSVFLRDQHGIDPQGYGFLMTSSAITVVLFQFGVSRWLRNKAPFLMMAFGTLYYMVGFTMFGLFSNYLWFVTAIVIITVGEMIVVPVSQALAANFAPEAMRGRYMAVFGFSWAIPQTIGPSAAGYIMDNFNPNLLWYLGGVLCALSVLSYYGLHLKLHKEERFIRRDEEVKAVPTAAD